MEIPWEQEQYNLSHTNSFIITALKYVHIWILQPCSRQLIIEEGEQKFVSPLFHWKFCYLILKWFVSPRPMQQAPFCSSSWHSSPCPSFQFLILTVTAQIIENLWIKDEFKPDARCAKTVSRPEGVAMFVAGLSQTRWGFSLILSNVYCPHQIRLSAEYLAELYLLDCHYNTYRNDHAHIFYRDFWEFGQIKYLLATL